MNLRPHVLAVLLLGCGTHPSEPAFPPANLPLSQAGPPIGLSITPLTYGQSATWTITGLNPQEMVSIGYSLGGTGAGGCFAGLGGLCLDLAPPASVFATAQADPSGGATLTR